MNRTLAKLEATYQVKDEAESLQISDFIHYVFENKDEFDLEGEGVSKLWMAKCPEEKAISFAEEMLKKNSHEVATSSLTEGVRMFRQELFG